MYYTLLQIAGSNPPLPNLENSENDQITLSFLDLALKGGWIMLPLLFLSIIAVYIFIERYYLIRSISSSNNTLFMDRIKEYILAGQVDQAITLCRSTNTPISKMIEKGIRRIGRPLNDVNAAIENVGNLEVSKLETKLPVLATISGAAPMIGFLGTVIGMIIAFYDMSKAGNNIDVGLLSNGIYTAMVTTVAGLIIGILTHFAYNTLVAKVDKVVFTMEASTSEFMDLLYEPVN